MHILFRLLALPPLLVAQASSTLAAGTYLQISYPPSAEPGELVLGVQYSLWVPGNVRKIRAVIVHQHGCGVGACKGGATAAHDLHWQALAEKWDAALLGPSYQQEEKQNCRLWCDPRNGSHRVFLRALSDLAKKSGHPELATAPWCLWGHSGGGFWASLMQTMYPERIVAIWFRSGTAYLAWQKGEIVPPEVPPSAYAIPAMCNPGVKEKDHPRFQGAWNGAMEMFLAYRQRGAPIGFAPDPRTGHECGDSRYLAIPFFDACLALRLPAPDGKDQSLRPVDPKAAWLAPLLGDRAWPATEYPGEVTESVWLPNREVARAWSEYVRTGATADSTPPPTPTAVKATRRSDGTVEVTWEAQADLESGIAAFVIQRDGIEIGRLPEKPVGRFGRALFQGMSHGDTPEPSLPEMSFTDKKPLESHSGQYRIITVNSAGLLSQPSASAKVKKEE